MESRDQQPVERKKKKGGWRDTFEALVTALLIAFFIRSFVFEAFKIPSGSMIPTLMIGDHLFVNKFIYGLRVPFTKIKIVTFRQPQRGEAIVFMYPLDESKDFIKRVVGLPGDRIRLEGDAVWINGVPLARKPVTVTIGKDVSNFPGAEDYDFFIEKTGETSHFVQFDRAESYWKDDFEVPAGHLFVMGDNRDNSSDSREWGFVPLENVKGKAMIIWLSIDFDHKTLRWDRFGKVIR